MGLPILAGVRFDSGSFDRRPKLRVDAFDSSHCPRVDLGIGDVALIILCAILRQSDAEHDDEWHDGTVFIRWGEVRGQLQERNHEEIHVGHDPEEFPQIDRKEGEDRVSGSADAVVGVSMAACLACVEGLVMNAQGAELKLPLLIGGAGGRCFSCRDCGRSGHGCDEIAGDLGIGHFSSLLNFTRIPSAQSPMMRFKPEDAPLPWQCSFTSSEQMLWETTRVCSFAQYYVYRWASKPSNNKVPTILR